MERLKVTADKLATDWIFHLHSSMERLKVFAACRRGISFRVFTFQYGEIKRMTVFHAQRVCVLIYIPVWRD